MAVVGWFEIDRDTVICDRLMLYLVIDVYYVRGAGGCGRI